MTARRIRGAIAMFLVFATGLSACSSDNTFLPALLADPMASYEADGIELIDRQTAGYVKDPFFGKYSPAEVESEYRIADVAHAEMRLDEAVKAAEAADWEMEESLTVPARFVGHKDLGVGEGRLIVVLGPDGGTERGRLHVLLGYASLNHEAK